VWNKNFERKRKKKERKKERKKKDYEYLKNGGLR
jgi:hypothetical protein